jgi:hypothetical protein
MKTSETEIRRHANGSIDTDYYVRHCRRQRSLAAHKAIGRFLVMIRGLIDGASEDDQHAPKVGATRSLSKQQKETDFTQTIREAA